MNRLIAGLLCAEHNLALSPLDAEAAKMFRRLKAYQRGRALKTIVRVDGSLIERWMCKVLVGLLVSGNATFKGAALRDWQAPREWVEVAFGTARMPAVCGLRFFNREARRERRQLAIMPTSDPTTGEVYGLTAELMSFSFHCAMRPVGTPDTAEGELVEFRPSGIAFGNDARFGKLLFDWPDDAGSLHEISIEPISRA